MMTTTSTAVWSRRGGRCHPVAADTTTTTTGPPSSQLTMNDINLETLAVSCCCDRRQQQQQDLYEHNISPQQVIYRKHWRGRSLSNSQSRTRSKGRTLRPMNHLTQNKLLMFVILIVINQLTHLFGASTTTGVVGAAASSAAALLRIEDLYQNDGEGGGSDDGDGSSSEDSDGILISSNLNSDNLYLINNKTLTPFSLSSANLVTAASIGDNPSPSVVIGGGNNGSGGGGGGSSAIGSGGHYLDKIDNLERSVAAVLIKVAYGTTSTTKRSIPDNSYVPSLTTIATPPLTTLRYLEKSQHQQRSNLHPRPYELDLERDHALPTSAPNADILKSNSNPTYPNPNRHHNHDRHRHLVANSTPSPSIHNLQKKGPPTNSMYSIDMPSYSPPARSFLTPPLPPEYTNPFADKPTLRGTNNDGGLSSVGGAGVAGGSSGVGGGAYINRRPIPPPSLMPGQERIPLRPPDLNGGGSGGVPSSDHGTKPPHQHPDDSIGGSGGQNGQRKKALNTPSQKVSNKMDSNGYDKGPGIGNGGVPAGALPDSTASNEGIINPTSGVNNGGGSVIRFQGISRILSGSNGRKEDIPEVLLRTATVRPSNTPQQQSPINHQPGSGNGQNPNINQSKNGKSGGDSEITSQDTDGTKKNRDMSSATDDDAGNDEYGDIFVAAEPQPKIKMSTKSTENPNRESSSSSSSSTQTIHNLANQKSLFLTTSTPGGGAGQDNVMTKPTAGSASSGGASGTSAGGATWSVAWNIHVYLSAILFTILAVYSIFKMIFYDKLTHLFNQSYFICIHLLLIVICMTRIFYLCYDAYNIHSSFHLFISEILLNLPATFLTIAFSVLILFLLIRSLNHKNNRYSALIRPLTVVVGSSVHVGLCITLHYVESYTTANNQQLYYQQQQLYRGAVVGAAGGSRLASVAAAAGGHTHHHHHQLQIPPAPPRVLSLICQIIYIFVCLSLGLLYLYLYRILKRVLRSKSQNYIHGYQNLSYAIHITIATALLFVLLAALQIYGALSISTTRPLITVAMEIDWLQWGYQFSLRLIEIAIITLMSWVAGLKTGGNSAGGVLQREKAGGGGGDTHNVSGFALFPCTSSSSQEHFETDYPAVCNANTNLHTYTLRTGKPIYDDNFALNSLGAGTGAGNSSSSGGSGSQQSNMTQQRLPLDFQLPNSGGDFLRSYETSSMRSASHHFHHGHSPHIMDSQSITGGSNFMCDSQTDHYENPNFELRGSTAARHPATASAHHPHQQPDNCYSEPTNPYGGSNGSSCEHAYDFQDLERPIFGGGGSSGDGVTDHGHIPHHHHGPRPNSRNDSHLKSLKSQNTTGRVGGGYQQPSQNILDRANYENPERRSSNSTHSCGSTRNHPTYNSFDRRNGGVRKSGTLNNIGGHNGAGCGGQIGGGRNNSTSSSSSSSHRPSGVQTLSSTHNRAQNTIRNGITSGGAGGPNGSSKQSTGGVAAGFYRGNERSHHHHRSSLERSNSSVMHPHPRQLHNPQQQQYAIPSSDDADDFCCPNPERATLINNSSSSGGLSATGASVGGRIGAADSVRMPSTTSGGNLTDIGGVISTSTSSSGGDSANSGSMLVAEHGFVRFRALDDMNNAQGVGIHNASIRASGGGGAGVGAVGGASNATNSGRHKEKQRCFTNNT